MEPARLDGNGEHGPDEFCDDCTGSGCWRLREHDPKEDQEEWNEVEDE